MSMRRQPLVFFTWFLLGSLAGPAPAQRRLPVLAEHQAGGDALARERARRALLLDLEGGRITLPEAARRAGGTLVLERRPNLECFPQQDVGGLADRSPLVIVGRPFVARVELTDDRRSIVTTYSVQVDDTLTARHLPALLRYVMVRLPGGRMDFGDGTSADIRSGPQLALGDRYVLFLQHERATPSGMLAAVPGTSAATDRRGTDGNDVIYTPLGVPHGVFHLRADSAIHAYPHDTSDRRRHERIPEAVFLAEIKAAVAARRFCIVCSSSPPVRF